MGEERILAVDGAMKESGGKLHSGLYPNWSIEPGPMESYNFIFVVQNKMPSEPLGWVHFTGLLELASD